MQVQPLSVRAHLASPQRHVGLGCYEREKSSELNPCTGLYCTPGWPRFNVSRLRERQQGADLSPGAKAVAGWRALTRATGHERLWQLLGASGAIGSAIDSVCLRFWGSQASSGPSDSSVQARDFSESSRPAGAPQPGQFMQAGHARFVSQAFNFDVLTVRLLRGESIDLDW